MPNFKLIGGSCNGTLVRVDVEPLPERLQMQARVLVPEGGPARNINGAVYFLHYLHGNPCYAVEGLSDSDILRKLLAR